MGAISDIQQPWRMRLVPASYRGATYHVEAQARSSGRRVVVHEYPKRDSPYAEDMGRHAIRYQITGYCIGPDYQDEKEALISQLEREGSGPLVDPYLPRQFDAICERYSVTEVRERGGYCVFEMLFVESGSPGNSPMFSLPAFMSGALNMATPDLALSIDTKSIVKDIASQAQTAAKSALNGAANQALAGLPFKVTF